MRKEKECKSKNLSKPRHKPTPAGYLGGGTEKLKSEHEPFKQSAEPLGQGYMEYDKKSK